MLRDRVGRLIESYRRRPQKEYLLFLRSIQKQGGLSAEEIMSIQVTAHVHSSAIIRHMAAQLTRPTLPSTWRAEDHLKDSCFSGPLYKTNPVCTVNGV